MFCRQCGAQTAERDKFCRECGHRQKEIIGPELMTPKDVAEAAGISIGQAYRLFKSKTFPSSQVGGKLVIPRARFASWMGETQL